MSVKCRISGQRPGSGNRVSHANNKTKRRFMPNLQRTTLLVNGARKSVLVSTRSLRTLAKKGRVVNEDGVVFEFPKD